MGKKVREAVQHAIDTGEQLDCEVEIADGRGATRKIRIVGEARTVDGKTESLFGITTDVTDQRTDDAPARRHSTMLDGASDPVVVFDLAGKVLYWNREAECVYGWTRAEVVGADVASLIAKEPEEHARIVGAVQRDRRWSGSTTHRTRSGKTLLVHGRLTLAVDADGEASAILGIYSDKAAPIALDEEEQRSTRLDAVVELTGGVAHDFNNLLTVILSGADLMLHRIDPGDGRILPLVRMTRDAAERGRDLVGRMLAFAQRQELEARSVDVNELVTNAEPLLQETVGDEIGVNIVRSEGLWQALVDPIKLESAIVNLCINARDAMEGRSGTLNVELRNTSLSETEAAGMSEMSAGDYVMISLSDTGCGMSRQTLARVFEPFFTTKTGTGSGLGLSMVYGFVKQSGGHIQANSELGVGTTVRIYLPRSDTFAEEPERLVARGIVRGSGEIVLVAEDDPEVRAHVTMMLETLGYRTLEADNGIASVRILESDARVDLLFSDVVMGCGMSGISVAHRAAALRPALPIVLTSGFARFPETETAGEKIEWPLLSKPYTLAQLSETLRTAFRETAPREQGASSADPT
ncbi:ATP-binding protein [Acuticoccus sp. MNP-M23]|uniref:ATP-binding protein n=1 Tax=Acuticoccus sp. MNP-M23 TaxID=3072793 RepID=UPI002814C52F|nr:ATP-binding protein [Acuticoccus sp. MNP-M23]WMS44833.1 ATP-binding protein [Acuticoccus sp. MNP-M23]